MPQIIVDIGHGFHDKLPRQSSFDPGAVSPHGVTEFSLNIIAGVALIQRLRSLGHVAAFVPYGLARYDRGLCANGYDCFISVHHNSAGGKRLSAQQARVLHQIGSKKRESEILAERVAEAIGKGLTITNHDDDARNLEVLRGAEATACRAAILTEAFFLDQGEPEGLLREMARASGYAIARAVDDHFRGQTA